MSEVAKSTKAVSAIEDDSDEELNVETLLGCVLTVKILEATDLVAADRGGLSDPYARVSFEKQKKKTKVIKKSLNPVWNETFQFDIAETTGSILVEIFDHDLFGSHDFLGCVEIAVRSLLVEAVKDEWFDLQPRSFRNDIVSGRLHLWILAADKNKEREDPTGLDTYPWIDLEKFRLPARPRESHVFRIYIASTFVDFVEEFKALHSDVFPRIRELCESKGYIFTAVDMRYGMDERMDRMYMCDPNAARLCFFEIEHCRQVSPRVNFLALLGDRYGSSCLPLTLDKNEFMALRSSISEDAALDDSVKEIERILEEWYVLDENQVPSRFVLRSQVRGVAPSCTPSTDKHNEWMRVENILFNALKSKSIKLLEPVRQRKFLVSLLEQQVTLGILLPPDANEHALCIIRGLANLRVVNPQSARYVDLKSRRSDVLVDGIKEIRADMIDEERRALLNNLKLQGQVRIQEKLGGRCKYVQAQWQGLSVTSNHLSEFCKIAYTLLQGSVEEEMKRFPRYGPLRHEIYLQYNSISLVAQPILRGRSSSLNDVVGNGSLGGGHFVWQGIIDYLSSRSDGSLKPLLIRGCQGSGISTILAAVWSCCNHECSQSDANTINTVREGTCLVYRHIGITPGSMTGGMLLAGVLTEIKTLYGASAHNDMTVILNILEGHDLPAADITGTSDPYVTVSLGSSADKQRAKTKVKKRTLNPQWNQSFTIDHISIDDSMKFAVWDHDMIGSDDVLGHANIMLSTLPLNKKLSLLLPISKEEVKVTSPTHNVRLKVVIVEGDGLLAVGQRMTVDPSVTVSLSGAKSTLMQTAFQKDTTKPVWNETFEFAFVDGNERKLCGEVWDGGGSTGDQLKIGQFECDLTNMTTGECLDGWYDLGLADGKTAPAQAEDSNKKSIDRGRIHLIITKEKDTAPVPQSLSDLQDTENASDQKDSESIPNSEDANTTANTTMQDAANPAPRIRIEITLISAIKSAEEAVGSNPWGGPWTYKDLASTFAGGQNSGLGMASASKPLVIILDGLQNLPQTDLICSLKWLPTVLPRNVHFIMGISSDSENRILSCLMQRKSELKILNLLDQVQLNKSQSEFEYSFGGEYSRKLLVQMLEQRHPVGNISDNQRAAILAWLGPSSRSLLLNIMVEIASCTPSFDSEIPLPPSSDSVKSISKAVSLLIEARIQHVNYGRLDVTRLWKVLAFLALSPLAAGGYSEMELRTLLGGANRDPIPGYLFAEVLMAIQPLVVERMMGGELVYAIKNSSIRNAILSRQSAPNAAPLDIVSLQNEMLTAAICMEEFNAGGQINQRKLILLLSLLDDLGKRSEVERLLGDLHHLDLRISCAMLWDVLMRLKVLGPGESGALEECLQLIEENAAILDAYPRLLLQLALNWPDNSLVYKQAVQLDLRRRGTLFLAHLPHQNQLKQAQEEIKTRLNERSAPPHLLNIPKIRALGVQDEDLAILPSMAMEWKCAKPWVRWHNKPQSREHCKLVLENQISQVNCILYTDSGSAILSAAAHGPLTLWSAATGELIESVNITELGHKPITIMTLSEDENLLITGGEDGKICAWDIHSENGPTLPQNPKYFISLHSSRVIGLSFLSAVLFVSCGDDREVKISDAHTGSEKMSFIPFRLQVTALDVSAACKDDPGLIATGGVSAVKFWRADNLDSRGALYSPLKYRITAVKFCQRTQNNLSDIPRTIAVAEWHNDVYVWQQQSAQKWSLFSHLKGHSSVVRALAWAQCVQSNGSIWLLSGGLDRTVTQWSIEIAKHPDLEGKSASQTRTPIEQTPVSTILGHTDSIQCITFHPQGTVAASSSRDGSIRIWDLNAAAVAAQTIGTPARHTGSVLSVGLGRNDDSVFAVSAGGDGRIKIWNLSLDGELLADVDAKHAGAISCVCITTSCRYTLTASNDGIIKRWDSESSYTCTAQVKAHRGGVAKLQPHPTGEFVLSVGATDGRITVWDISSMQDVVLLQGPVGQPILQAVFASDGKMIISADTSYVRLWNMDIGREMLAKPLGESQNWTHVDFSGDGRFLITSSCDAKTTGTVSPDDVAEPTSTLVVWDASRGLQREGNLTVAGGLGSGIVATAFSADARFVCATLRDHWLHVWHLPTRAPLAGFSMGQEPSKALCCGVAWPRITVGDVAGTVYFLEFVAPQPPDIILK